MMGMIHFYQNLCPLEGGIFIKEEVHGEALTAIIIINNTYGTVAADYSY